MRAPRQRNLGLAEARPPRAFPRSGRSTACPAPALAATSSARSPTPTSSCAGCVTRCSRATSERIAHRLKGTAANFGLVAIAAVAETIEREARAGEEPRDDLLAELQAALTATEAALAQGAREPAGC